MFNALTISSIYVLDQKQALDFYVGKLGLEVNSDQDLGFMRWLTVNVPGDSRQVLLEKPGPPAHDQKTAEQVRELVTKGATGGHLFFTTTDCQKTYEETPSERRRDHRGADKARLRHRLRAARSVRQPHPFHAAAPCFCLNAEYRERAITLLGTAPPILGEGRTCWAFIVVEAGRPARRPRPG